MPRTSNHHPRSPSIAIVGGGIASLVAGITLREKLPNAAITLYTEADESMLGGQLASWDEHGYPVEHGLHALFGFYDHILPILKAVGAYGNLTRSKEHIFIRERDAIHRFDLRTWPATFRGFTAAQKVRMLTIAPAIGKLLLDFKARGCGAFDAYDRFDLRTLARAQGVPESVLQSGFFRQLYEAAFNAPSELSAAVALQSIYRIFSKRWHYYFKLPTRESIIEPLRRHFVDGCHGRIEFNRKLIRVRTDDPGMRAAGLDFENQATGGRFSVEADEYLLALGLEGFKRVDFGEAAGRNAYFTNVRKLQTVSSFSVQAWFKEDPVPPGIDSLITGMPQPFGILCPITRVRATRPPEGLPLQHELIATGPERGYEDIPDDIVKADFIDGLRAGGFRIPDDPLHMHVVLRRNREPSHRYLLTRPGELHWRPAHQSPLENLCLAGAWVRNEFALPCVEAAAQGAIKAVGLIAERLLARPENVHVGRLAGTPRYSPPRNPPPVVPPPYSFPRSTGSFFLLDANRERLAAAIAADLALFPGLSDTLLFAVLRHEDVHAQRDPSGARYAYNEVLIAAFVRKRGFDSLGRIGIYPISVYVDDITAMAAGREVYGFPKTLARVDLGTHEMSLARCDSSPGRGSGSARITQIMSADWSCDPRSRASGDEPRAAKSILALQSLGCLAKLMAFYNTRRTTHSRAYDRMGCDSSQLTKVSLTDTKVRRVSSLPGLRLRVNSSIDEPIRLLTQADRTTSEICGRRGVKVEWAFSMGPARIVGAAERLAGPARLDRSGFNES